MSVFRQALRRDSEQGVALIMVLGVVVLCGALITAGIAYAVGAQRSGRHSQDWNAALAAAYAGIEEYQSRLANDTTYFQYGNPSAAFGDATPETRTLPSGANENPAFGLGTAGTWGTVPGSGGKAQFRYEVDNTKYATDGSLRLRSTGRVGNETRSIVADLKQQGFIDFLYFTDYEIQDPQLTGDPATCVKYAWAGRTQSLGCAEIAFGSNDQVNGPAHSNDTIRICDARFKGTVTTGYNPTSGLRYTPKDSNGNSCSGATFDLAGYPASAPVIAMPPTNTQLKKEVRSDVAGVRPGCLYTGPTKIVFNDNGTMTVRSPWTRKTNVVGDPATSGSSPAECGTPGSGSGALGSAAGQTITVPQNNVVYVQNVPSTSSDPNYWASGTVPSGLSVTTTGAMGGNGLGYPATGEVTPLYATTTMPAYGYRNGDVFVQGTLKGSVTVAAENYVYVTGDVVYASSAVSASVPNILGLIGNNAVFVWNPMKSSGGGGYTSMLGNNGREIDAAILSVAHVFTVQNFDRGGARGSLTIKGAIAQKYRGIVRSGSNGYTKDYNYDERFRYTAPPKFLSPVTTTYGVNVWVEVKPAFSATGAYN